MGKSVTVVGAFISWPDVICIYSNETRKKHIANQILSKLNDMGKSQNKPVVGKYRISMKEGSDNYKSSGIIDVIKLIETNQMEIVIYEQMLDTIFLNRYTVINDLDCFKSQVLLLQIGFPKKLGM